MRGARKHTNGKSNQEEREKGVIWRAQHICHASGKYGNKQGANQHPYSSSPSTLGVKRPSCEAFMTALFQRYRRLQPNLRAERKCKKVQCDCRPLRCAGMYEFLP
ncbi:hypothetical protein BaRGS_00019914 [Batillaria attramentaria]|uniref:Uncharacterized protein n=1 Tax=Batillaria attramentaria TaxID=370345 RepID=A0ABD0KNX3_9CAEN